MRKKERLWGEEGGGKGAKKKKKNRKMIVTVSLFHIMLDTQLNVKNMMTFTEKSKVCVILTYSI